MKHLAVFVVLALVGLGGVSVAFAAGDVFTVRGVEVDATAAGAAEAREIALADGRISAYDRLIKRLTRRQDWPYAPKVSSQQLQQLLLGIEVAEERASATRYIAKISYSFKPNDIRALLRRAGIAYTEARSKPALVLPVLETDEGLFLWEEPNPWREAWTAKDLTDELVPILVPSGDLQDLSTLTASQAVDASWLDVQGIADKYGLDRVIVALATVGASAGEGNLNVSIAQLSANRATSTQFNFAGGGDLELQLSMAVDSAFVRISEEWKAATIVNFGQEDSIFVSVWFKSMSDWLSIRTRLRQAPTILSLDLLSISPEGAEVRLRFAGTTEQLRITLEQLSLVLFNEAGYWRIARTEDGIYIPPSPEEMKSGPELYSNPQPLPQTGSPMGAPSPFAPMETGPMPSASLEPAPVEGQLSAPDYVLPGASIPPAEVEMQMEGVIEGTVDPSLVTTVPSISR